MHALSARLRRDDGFVMVIALIVTLVIVALAAALITASTTTSTHATHERGRSTALALADAGLEAAIHRLSSQYEDGPTQQEQCFTVEFKAKEASGVCPAQTEEIASQQKYTYYVSPAMKTNECAGLWVVAPKGRTITQRCVTSIGEANGSAARVQERIVQIMGVFPVSGIFSLSEILVNNELTFNGELGARGKINFNNPVKAIGSGLKVKYGESVTGESKCPSGCTYTKMSAAELAKEPYALPEPYPQPFEAAEASAATENAKITMTSGSINASREMTANNPTTIKFPSGTYDLCAIALNGTATIEYSPPVTLYLDSHYRSGTTCPNNSGSGSLQFNNAVTWVDLASVKSPSDLRMFAWGEPKETNNHTPKFQLNNNVTGPWYAEIWAPYSYLEVNNSLTMDGAIQAGYVQLNNPVEFAGITGQGEGQTGQTFYPSAFHQCPPTYSGTNPASGCY